MSALMGQAVAGPQAPDRTASAITADGLVKKYGEVTALDGLSLAVAPGTVFGLLGPNGRSYLLSRDRSLAQGGVRPAEFDDWSLMTAAPWWITAMVATLPIAVLGMGAALAHLISHDYSQPTGSGAM